jgi:squalene cyclase
MISGYPSILILVEAGSIIITTLSFFVSAYSRGSKEYFLVGVGALLAFFGRHMLFAADTWVTPFPGLAILAAGTWLICRQLHRVYLWL